jgi:hypothetical protein
MTETTKKLQRDLAIMATMASEMSDYVRSDVLFWRMSQGNMPKLTFGGYLMRQHRLVALRNDLTLAEQDQLRTAMDQFDSATQVWTVRVESRIHQEVDARVRQWGEFLRDLQGGAGSAVASFPTAVEARCMLTHLLDYLYQPGYQVLPRFESEISLMDTRLSNLRKVTDFVWDEAWQPAYPVNRFDYLYRGE